VLGPGDDCAILKTRGANLLFTVDSLVEGVHFALGWMRGRDLGARALTVNLSDIAAMGGRPTACVVNLALRDGIETRVVDQIYAGLEDAAATADVDIVGGNINRARELSITIAMLGELRGTAMRRDSARIGDQIFVTGTLGDAALGWRLLAGKLQAPKGKSRTHLIDRYVRPAARLAAAQNLVSLRPMPAAIDISDGLLQDLEHILERSKVGAEIDALAVPVSSAYRSIVGEDLSYALGGGEDYELLFCARPRYSESEFGRRLGLPVRQIGRIVRGRGLKVTGAAKIAGWDQLRSGELKP
jgi:thiamine-monophosphate kinase